MDVSVGAAGEVEFSVLVEKASLNTVVPGDAGTEANKGSRTSRRWLNRKVFIRAALASAAAQAKPEG